MRDLCGGDRERSDARYLDYGHIGPTYAALNQTDALGQALDEEAELLRSADDATYDEGRQPHKRWMHNIAGPLTPTQRAERAAEMAQARRCLDAERLENVDLETGEILWDFADSMVAAHNRKRYRRRLRHGRIFSPISGTEIRRPPADTPKCPQPLFELVAFTDGEAVVHALRCKRWSCPSCGRGKRAEALKLMHAGMSDRGIRIPLRFVTVTFRTEAELQRDRESSCYVTSVWSRIVGDFRRMYGRETLEYSRVIEYTKRGRPHIHALTKGHYMPKCGDDARRRHGLATSETTGADPVCLCAGSGYVCDLDDCPDARLHRHPCIQAVAWSYGAGFIDVRRARDNPAALVEMAKYLAKVSGDGRYPKYARRLSTSRRWSEATLGSIHQAYMDRLAANHPKPADMPEIADRRLVPYTFDRTVPPYPDGGKDPPGMIGFVVHHPGGPRIPIPYPW